MADAPAYRRLLLLLTQRLGEIPRTRLHKLVYLIDLEHYLRHGHTLTGAPWVRQKYGPMPRSFLPAMRDMRGYELVERAATARSGRDMMLVGPGPSPRFTADFNADEVASIDFVVSMTASLSDADVRAIAYATTPMQLILADEAIVGHEVLDRAIDFATLAGAGRAAPERSPGDAQAYASFKHQERDALEGLRDQALGALHDG